MHVVLDDMRYLSEAWATVYREKDARVIGTLYHLYSSSPKELPPLLQVCQDL